MWPPKRTSLKTCVCVSVMILYFQRTRSLSVRQWFDDVSGVWEVFSHSIDVSRPLIQNLIHLLAASASCLGQMIGTWFQVMYVMAACSEFGTRERCLHFEMFPTCGIAPDAHRFFDVGCDVGYT